MNTPRPVASCLALAAGVLLASPLMVAAPQDQAQPQPPSQPPAVSAEDQATHGLLTRICTPCHDELQITATRRTKVEWQEVIMQMIEKGAAGDGQEFEAVWGYLRRHHGRVYINYATTDEITVTLGLSSEAAGAIIAYRDANGPFTDLDSLTKVPDIDVEVIEAHKDAIAF